MASRNPRKQKAIRPVGDVGTGLYDALVQATNTPPAVRLPVRHINLSDIVRDKTVQVRVDGLDKDKVEEYRIRLENGSEAPPIDVFPIDQSKYLLAAGFHRVEAYRLAGRTTIEANIHQGDIRDARELAEEDNLQHGLPYTLADKFNIFQRRYLDGRTWFESDDAGKIQQIVSNREIAKSLGVSAMTIGRWKDEVESVTGVTVDDSKVVGADGRTRDVSQIKQNAAKRFEDHKSDGKDFEALEAAASFDTEMVDDSFAPGAEYVPASAYYESNPPTFDVGDERATLVPASIEPTANPFGQAEFSTQEIYGMYRTMVLKIEELDKLHTQLAQIRGLEHFPSIMGRDNMVKLERELQRGLQVTHSLDQLLQAYLQSL